MGDNFKGLVEIPCEHFADSKELRKVLRYYDSEKLLEGVSVSLDNLPPDVIDFWQTIFQKKEILLFL